MDFHRHKYQLFLLPPKSQDPFAFKKAKNKHGHLLKKKQKKTQMLVITF